VRARHEGGATSELRIQGESAFAMNILNRQVRLASRPQGIPQAEHFTLGEEPVPPLLGGLVLVRNAFLSVDPAMRGWVNAAANYAEPVAVGAVMRSFAVGEVVRSRHPAHSEGDLVFGMLGWQEWVVVDGGPSGPVERKVNDIPASGLPLSAALGVLGLNGATAYFGLLEVGMPRAGEVVAVSSAAGAVGSCVGQIAKIVACRTIGIVGGRAKADLCRTEFGFDATVDYKAADFEEALAAASPDGIDVYFDNTSGVISDAVMRRINTRGRIVICGTAAIADWDPRRSARVSSASFLSAAPKCRDSSRRTTKTVGARLSPSWVSRSATEGSGIVSTCWRASSKLRERSPCSIAARTWESWSSG
jgi:NADPH-dependent curcumin reductase